MLCTVGLTLLHDVLNIIAESLRPRQGVNQLSGWNGFQPPGEAFVEEIIACPGINQIRYFVDILLFQMADDAGLARTNHISSEL